jgi:hypothetical protein
MKRLIFSTLLILSSVAAWCQYPHQYIQDLQHVAQVTLPDSPVVDSLKTNILYRVVNDKVIYVAGCSRTVQSFRGTINLVYTDAINDMIDVTNGTIVYKKDITEQGLKGIEIETRAAKSDTNYNLFFRVFYFNDVLITQGMVFPKEVQRTDNRINNFFSTFKLVIKPKDIRQNTSVSTLTVLKYVLIIVLVLAIIVALIVFLVRRSNSKTTQ